MRKIAIFAVAAVFSLGLMGARAETPPADAAIKSVRQDLVRFERQAKGLSPSRKANIKRLQRLVKIVRQRLDGSPNRAHPSWVETDARLSHLEKGLADMLAGRSPAQAPAPAQAARPAKPAAPAVAQPAHQATARPQPAKPAAPASPASKPTAAAGTLTSLERTRLSRVRREVMNLQSSMNRMRERELVALQAPARQASLRNRVKSQKAQLAAIGKPGHPDIRKQAAEIDKLAALVEARIGLAAGALTPKEKGQVEKTARRINAAWQAIKGLSPLTLQHKGAPAKYGTGIEGSDREVKALPKQGHPEVKKLAGVVAEMRAMLAKKLGLAKALSAKYGYVSGRVAAIRAKYAPKNLPPKLAKPLTVASTKAWAESFTILNKELDKDVAYLETLKKDKVADLGSALFWVRDNSRRLLGDRVNEATQWVDNDVRLALERAKFVQETNAKDRNHIANRLLGEGKFEKTMEQLRDGLNSIAVASVFDTTIQRRNGPARPAQKAKIEAAIVRLQELTKLALAEIRMPKARSTDAKLLAVAARILKDPKHKAGNAKRMVINFGPKRMEKTEGWISHGSSSSTVSVYHYVWDEFQVTTAEQVGGKWFMHANRFRYYHKGAPRTPLKMWYLSERFRSSEILEKNIGK